jgi:hypothetical protein
VKQEHEKIDDENAKKESTKSTASSKTTKSTPPTNTKAKH